MLKLSNILYAVLLGIAANTCFAHATSDAFLYISTEHAAVTGRWDIHVRDLELAVGVDIDSDGRISWGELDTRRDIVLQALSTAIAFKTAHGECSVDLNNLQAAQRNDGLYASVLLTAKCAQPANDLTIDYRFLFDLDAHHKALLAVSGAFGERSAVLSAQSPSVTLSPGSLSVWQTMQDYLIQGVWHIWIGLDHILFLVVLLLPAGRYLSQAERAAGVRPVIWRVLSIVTAFTVAHSITLTLAVMDVIAVPSRWVESAIAASVIVAAANTWIRRFDKRLPLLTFCFGLVHGLGFAGVLSELGLPPTMRAIALVAFNMGVELGQLTIVLLALPVILLWRNSDFYLRRAVPAVAASVGALAFIWLFERITAA